MERSGRLKKFLVFGSLTIVVLGVVGVVLGFVFYPKSDEDDQIVGTFIPMWGWRCEDDRCQKYKLTSENSKAAFGLNMCRFKCGMDNGTVWPMPTGNVEIITNFSPIDLNEITFCSATFDEEDFWIVAQSRFRKMQKRKFKTKKLAPGGSRLTIEVIAHSDDMSLTYDTNEGYELTLSTSDKVVKARITADNFYGCRNGLETLSQLIIFDDIRNKMSIVERAVIKDAPKFKHRGLSLDTSRNFYSIGVLKRTIDGMALVKLNQFHWHITDSQSFPLALKSHPELAEWGAYASNKIYTPEDVRELTEFAKARGIRIIIEIDTPGHVGESWFQKNLTSCYSSRPTEVCKGARPCGQLDPSKDEVYQVLEDIYRELNEIIGDMSIIHMGGDEVFVECWNASASLQDWMLARGGDLSNDDFMNLWGYFQKNAINSLDRATKDAIPVILWTSTLTVEPWLTKFLNKARYIIQVWTKGNDKEVTHLLEEGYSLILSNYDALYLDCGFGSWVRDWCLPYIGWQKVYDNRMEQIAGDYVGQVLGAEGTLFSEQVDEFSIDARLWPRLSALAERLWSSPDTAWREAEARMLIHRTYLVEVGKLGAETLQPEWCLQNEGSCPL